MPRPDFSNIELNLERKIAQDQERKWISPEQIEIKENYCSEDIKDMSISVLFQVLLLTLEVLTLDVRHTSMDH